ncbi:hypothetical protein GCM10022408_36730 [Hymenobacter fastidiosus]|uniref:Cardiolipin synthase N-terminal domain-containing protein n=1 Tax=Hymenobacter fastidiosus TaxID=486264 RepID=A0ABP7T0P6_9BACT
MNKLTSLASRLPVASLLIALTVAVSSCSRFNSNGRTSLWGMIILVLDVLALIDVFRQPWTIGKKLLWAAIIFFFPIGGLIIYYLFAGRGKSSL